MFTLGRGAVTKVTYRRSCSGNCYRKRTWGPSLQALAAHIKTTGPIKTVGVSSAQASCPYSYWGAVRYAIRLTKRDGWPANVPLERASSDRRSYEGAERDALEIAEDEGRILFHRIGRLSEEEAANALSAIRSPLRGER